VFLYAGIVAVAAVNHKDDSRDIECPDTTRKLLLPQGEGKKNNEVNWL
jgi:hypothetical protein